MEYRTRSVSTLTHSKSKVQRLFSPKQIEQK